MKHIQWIAMACLTGFSAFALRPGDPAEELMVKWIQGGPVAVLPSKNPDPEAPEYKAVVFLLTRAANRDETLNLLGYLNRIHAGKVRFAVVTPDRETDAAAMLRERPDFKLPVAVDTDRKITSQYMSGNLLFPMAFLFDREGEIVWSGEAIDLDEVLRACRAGTFNRSVQPKLAPLLDELQTLLRDNDERRMKAVVDSILALDPGNAAALRIRLFVLESNGRIPEAEALVDAQIEAAPQLARLYFTALDLLIRHPAPERLGALTRRYLEAVRENPAADNLMAWRLLNGLPGDPVALTAAKRLTERAMGAPAGSAADQGALATTRALLEYRLGRPAEALKLQREATAHWKNSGTPGAEADSAAKEKFYRTVLSLAAGV